MTTIKWNYLQLMKKTNSINGNKKAAIESCFDVPVETRLTAGIPISKSYHKSHTISQTLSTVARCAMSYRFNCACSSIKHIYSFCHKRGHTAYCPTDWIRALL